MVKAIVHHDKSVDHAGRNTKEKESVTTLLPRDKETGFWDIASQTTHKCEGGLYNMHSIYTMYITSHGIICPSMGRCLFRSWGP